MKKAKILIVEDEGAHLGLQKKANAIVGGLLQKRDVHFDEFWKVSLFGKIISRYQSKIGKELQ